MNKCMCNDTCRLNRLLQLARERMDLLRRSISALPGKESKHFLIPNISGENILPASRRLSGSGTDLHVSNNIAPLPILATCLLQNLMKYLLLKKDVTIIHVLHTCLNFCEH